MGLRCAARSTSMRDSIVLSIGDNLSEILASDKGRSSDPVTNAQLRRAAGLTAAAGISWRRRHIETGRNPTDKGSRIADDGELAPERRFDARRRSATPPFSRHDVAQHAPAVCLAPLLPLS